MHSSRMSTVRALPYRGVSVRGSLCQGDSPPTHTDKDPFPPVDRMTDASKNITLPQTLFAGGKYIPCISPNDVFGDIVYCQRVGPAEVVADDLPLFGDRSVHPDSPDVSVIAPVRVE